MSKPEYLPNLSMPVAFAVALPISSNSSDMSFKDLKNCKILSREPEEIDPIASPIPSKDVWIPGSSRESARALNPGTRALLRDSPKAN